MRLETFFFSNFHPFFSFVLTVDIQHFFPYFYFSNKEKSESTLIPAGFTGLGECNSQLQFSRALLGKVNNLFVLICDLIQVVN